MRHEVLSESELVGDAGFFRLYESSFPAAERESCAVIVRSVQLGSGLAFRSVEAGGTLAMATVQLLASAHLVFLVYLAVERGQRGKGVGKQLLRFAFATALRRFPGVNGFVWEVDRIEDGKDEHDVRVRRDRLRFFEHQGGRIVCSDYLQPALDGVNTVAMNLLFRPGDLALEHLHADVGQIVRSIYFDKYGAVNGISSGHLEDLLLRQMPPRPPYVR